MGCILLLPIFLLIFILALSPDNFSNSQSFILSIWTFIRTFITISIPAKITGWYMFFVGGIRLMCELYLHLIIVWGMIMILTIWMIIITRKISKLSLSSLSLPSISEDLAEVRPKSPRPISNLPSNSADTSSEIPPSSLASPATPKGRSSSSSSYQEDGIDDKSTTCDEDDKSESEIESEDRDKQKSKQKLKYNRRGQRAVNL